MNVTETGGRALGITKQQTQVIRVLGEGESQAMAFASALNNVSKNILKDSKDVLIRIEPMDITVIRAVEKKYTERFLFFFFRRTRTSYEVELDVKVSIGLIELDDVSFTPMDVEASNGISIPFTTKKI